MTEPPTQSLRIDVPADPAEPTSPAARSIATVPIWSTGTLAARPAAGMLLRFYWQTDAAGAGVGLYVDNGSAWQKVTLT